MILPKSYLYLLNPALLCLCAGFLVYALFSSPTPDNPNLVELLTASMLLSGVVFLSVRGVTTSQSLFEKLGAVFAFYVFSLVVLRGVSSGYDVNAILRDIMAVLFLFLPLAFLKIVQKRDLRKILIMASIAIGVIFSIRELITLGGLELLYLANSPLVLFAAIFLFGVSLKKMSQTLTPHNLLIISTCLLLSFICLGAMSINLQRAPLAFFMISACLMIGLSVRHSLVPLFVTSLLALIFISHMELPLSFLLFDFLEKQRLSGLNMRIEEALAVVEYLGQNPMDLLFGLGWGASFPSPAVAGIWVSFTHNFFSAFLLKAGLLGVALSIVYAGFFVKMLWQTHQQNFILSIALAAPFLIGISLYANYKSLGFGLILSIIALTHHEQKEKHSIY